VIPETQLCPKPVLNGIYSLLPEKYHFRGNEQDHRLDSYAHDQWRWFLEGIAMGFPTNARKKKLTRQFPGEDIWDLIEQGKLNDGADWLREEVAKRNWSFEQAAICLETDGSFIWRIIQRQKRPSRCEVRWFASVFGYLHDNEGNITTDKVVWILALFGYM
jgi:hypothetical protein